MNATNQTTAGRRDVRLEVLSRYDCWQLVTEAGGRDGIARVVWATSSGPAIVPVNYAVADGFLWTQTGEGSRLARECCGQEVLVEVDSVDTLNHTGWSVVVSGVASCVQAKDDPGLLSDLLVWPGGPHELLVRIEPQELTGRRVRHG